MGCLYKGSCWMGFVGRVSSQVFSATSHLELLFLSQQVVVFIAFVQGDQHVLEPIPHTQRELSQLCVQAGGDDCKTHTAVSTVSKHAAPVPSHLSSKPA